MANNKEWEKEMMKWRKIDIINLLEKVIKEQNSGNRISPKFVHMSSRS